MNARGTEQCVHSALLSPSPEGEASGVRGEVAYCVITIAAVRLSGIVTDETSFVSGGKL